MSTAPRFEVELEQLALAELVAAQAGAAEVIAQADFDAKCELAREVGGCGRRIELLLRGGESVVPFRYGEDDLRPAGGFRAALDALAVRYDDTVLAFTGDRLLAWDELRRLESARALHRPSVAARSEPAAGSEPAAAHPREPVADPDPVWARARRATPEHGVDPRWLIAAPGELVSRVARADAGGLMHKLHHTAFRETLAVEVASLNLYEYEGLPWQFFVDMTRQIEDESRHAAMCWARFVELGGSFDDFTLPFVGNYFEMYWEMDLVERLVAMNLDIEAQGQQYLRDLAARLEPIDGPSSELFAFIARDEQRHGQIGVRWLRHLIPDRSTRRARVAAARGLQVVGVASAFVAATGASVVDQIDAWTRGQPVSTYRAPHSSADEPEVGLGTGGGLLG